MKKYIDKEALIQDKLKDNNIKCKCSHVNTLNINEDKKICKWCGNYIFKNKQAEFEYRLKERMVKER